MDRLVRLSLPALLLIPPLAAHARQRPDPAPVAITHVTLIDTEAGATAADMTVLVRDGRIAAVERAGAALPAGVREVNGRGKFLIPGLWDMHVHLSWTTASALPVLLANGVTAVRDLGSDLAEIDAWRAEINAGRLAGPRIFRAGPILNGRSFNRYQLVTGSPDQARGIVRALKQVGVDLIKVHRRVPRDDYFALVEEARTQGLRVVGHIPMTVRPEEASDAGQLIEHTETLFEGTFAEALGDRRFPEAIRQFRDAAADTLFARFARNGTAVTPMLGLWRFLIEHPDTVALFADPRMRYVARSLRDAARRTPPPFTAEQMQEVRESYAEYAAVAARLARSGVTLLAGSDIAGARIPGFSLHDELAALVAAGLTPLEALRAATANPARILGAERDYGSVARGKRADLVLLDGNPLEDIRNTRRIAAVVAGGHLLRRADLDALLNAGEEMATRN